MQFRCAMCPPCAAACRPCCLCCLTRVLPARLPAPPLVPVGAPLALLPHIRTAMASQQLWDPAPVLYFESSGSARSAAGGPRPLRIWFAYLSYHAGTGAHAGWLQECGAAAPPHAAARVGPAAAAAWAGECPPGNAASANAASPHMRRLSLASAGRYPIDAHLRRLGPCDHVFLFLTWHRLGFDTQRLRCYAAFPCQAGPRPLAPRPLDEMRSVASLRGT